VSGSTSPAIYLDANTFIDLLEGEPALSSTLQSLFERLRSRPGLAMTSELTLAEVLAPGVRRVSITEQQRQAYLDLIVFGGHIELAPVSREILYATADLRRSITMKLFDAIHLATAISRQCRFFVSRDTDFKRMPPGISKVEPNSDTVAKLEQVLA
jgi:predicted nucleic acid-binding protein